MTNVSREPKRKREQDRKLGEELEKTLPASDPPSSTQPGSGVTGSEAKNPRAGKKNDSRRFE